ncbi:hypothetical protein CCONF_03680 [Corynebacterium confusum]|nr:hypothetical protein CCONF_03680 [Corynebacterium confusum]
MQNELRISAGGLYSRPQTHTEADFEPGHGLQRRPRTAVEDDRDGRGGDARLLRDPLDASVAVPLAPVVNHHGLDHLVFRRAHVQAVRPARVKAGGATGLRSYHALTVAPGTSNALLGGVVAAFGPQVGFASVLVWLQRQLQHGLGTRHRLGARPRRTGPPPTKNRVSYTRVHREFALRARPSPLDLQCERLPHQPRLLVGGGQLFGVNIRPLGVGGGRRVKSAHGCNRIGYRSAFRDAQHCGGRPLARKWGTR